jgi:MarR family transcriptional regulator, organic hydroperoxide resistance regulator
MAIATPPAGSAKLAGETLQFMQRLWRLAHGLDVASKRMARTLGVTGPQRLVLRVIGLHPGISAQGIAKTLGMHPSTLTGVLARLGRRGFVTRAVDAADRRRARLRLTAAGRAINRERKGTVEAAVRRAMARAGRRIIPTLEMLELLTAELERGG